MNSGGSKSLTTNGRTSDGIDTNVIVYSLYEDARHHEASRALMLDVERGLRRVAALPQVFFELNATVTHPKRTSNPYTPAEALKLLETVALLPGMVLLPSPVDLLWRVHSLLHDAPVTDRKVFDRVLASGYLAYGVHRLFSYNLQDFRGIHDFEAVEPPEVRDA